MNCFALQTRIKMKKKKFDPNIASNAPFAASSNNTISHAEENMNIFNSYRLADYYIYPLLPLIDLTQVFDAIGAVLSYYFYASTVQTD